MRVLGDVGCFILGLEWGVTRFFIYGGVIYSELLFRF